MNGIMDILTLIAAFITGLLASLGVGGGMVLIVWETCFLGVGQLEAQGINLIFFLPIALLSCILHRKNGMIKIKPLIPAIITGTLGAAAGALLAGFAGSDILGKCFSVFILLIGIRELFTAKDRE